MQTAYCALSLSARLSFATTTTTRNTCRFTRFSRLTHSCCVHLWLCKRFELLILPRRLSCVRLLSSVQFLRNEDVSLAEHESEKRNIKSLYNDPARREITVSRHTTCSDGDGRWGPKKSLYSPCIIHQHSLYSPCIIIIPQHSVHTCVNFEKSRYLVSSWRLSIVPAVQGVRQKSSGKNAKQMDELAEEDILDDDDYDAPSHFKKMTIHLKSLRADSLVSSALDISRNNVDEMFYASRLRLNGEKLLKKSKQVSERDFVDVVMERGSEEDQLMVKRVKVIKLSEEKTNKDKTAVTVKVWKSAFSIPDTHKR